MGVRREDNASVRLVRQFDVIDKAAAPGKKANVFNPPNRLADSIGLHVEMLGHGRSSMFLLCTVPAGGGATRLSSTQMPHFDL